jgi:hypothetical protein
MCFENKGVPKRQDGNAFGCKGNAFMHLQKNFVARAITFLQVQYPTPLRN